jgi:dCMP deaminase
MHIVRQPLDEYMLGLLPPMATRSTCVRRAVAAIITNDKGHILATGFNGVPSGIHHCTETACPGAGDKPGNSQRCEAVHAEANALLQCRNLDDATTMYCSATPCFWCAKMICNTPIRRVVCVEPYADQTGMQMLIRCGIKVVVWNE